VKDTLKTGSKEECIESIEERGYTCSAPHTPHTLHHYSDKEKRLPINIRLRRTIHDEFMRYCALSHITAGQFYENAGIFYMDLNPIPEGTVLVVSKPEKRNNLKDRTMILRCIQDLQKLIESLERYTSQRLPIPTNLMEKLCQIFDKYDKINNPSDELNGLIEEALRYVE